MGEWKEYRLEEVAEKIGMGPFGSNIKVSTFVSSGIPVISGEHLHNSKLTENSFNFITEEHANKLISSNVYPGDVIFTHAGNINQVSRIPKNSKYSRYIISQRQFFLRCNLNKLSPEFITYYFKSREGQYKLLANTSSTGVPSIAQPVSYLKSVSIMLPPIYEQRNIASILSSLDDKIDLLHRQNKTLEQLAETLFRQWFVEEADESWEIQPLGNLVTVKRGGSPRPIHDYISSSGLRWLKISDVTSINSPFIFDIKEHIKEDGLNKTVFLKKGSLVLSNSATPGIPKILQVDSCIHDGWLYFPKSYFSNEFLYLLFNSIRPELLIQGNGSIFTNLKTDILKEYKITIPPEKDLLVIQNKIKHLFDKQLFNANQIRTLTQLRDSLLPKLMSGDVRVKN